MPTVLAFYLQRNIYYSVVKQTEHDLLTKSRSKNVNDNDRAIQCDLCNYWFSLIAITLIMLTINSFKIPMILGIVFSVAAKLSYLIL